MWYYTITNNWSDLSLIMLIYKIIITLVLLQGTIKFSLINECLHKPTFGSIHYPETVMVMGTFSAPLYPQSSLLLQMWFHYQRGFVFCIRNRTLPYTAPSFCRIRSLAFQLPPC